MNAAEDYLRKPTSVGVGIPTNDVVLEDPDTGERFTTPGRKGEVLIRGPNISGLIAAGLIGIRGLF
jgi:long-subunit acyl-CoA synthetase (AMP-forming)